jgi:heme/copper-type cytochrome/quinol oxidase subunit 2
MKALSFIGLVFSAFLLFLGISSRNNAGTVLSNAIITGGVIIGVFVIIVWVIMFLRGKKKKGSDTDF